jgi:hypothetical protein
MLLHELFNLDEPTCLYCQGECWVKAWGEALMFSDTYTCKICKEAFSITGMRNEPNEINGFTFTCNGISAHQNYEFKSFGLKKISEDDWKYPLVWMPEFLVDFSDKEGLFKKLKIYLLFS